MESLVNNIGDEARPARCWFDAVLHPHRSLSPRGFFILMGVLSFFALSLGLRFFLVGAWPVMGFMGLDVLAVYIAFKVNYRRARLFETVHLTDDHLTVRRVQPNGSANEWHFMPSWVSIRMDDPPTFDSPLTLSSHGRKLEIGAFLTPEERLQVAHALNDAIRRQQAGLVGAAPEPL